MADIFISYSREDREWVESLAAQLQSEGFSVWWDWDLLVGKRYRESIDHELQSCRVAVVVWSQHSIQSDFVRDEAEEAQQRNILVPVLKEVVPPPAGFRQIQTADLSTWTGGGYPRRVSPRHERHCQHGRQAGRRRSRDRTNAARSENSRRATASGDRPHRANGSIEGIQFGTNPFQTPTGNSPDLALRGFRCGRPCWRVADYFAVRNAQSKNKASIRDQWRHVSLASAR